MPTTTRTPKNRGVTVAATARWRYGDRDREALAAHNLDTRRWRRELADAEFPPRCREQLLVELARTPDMVEAASAVGVSHELVYGRMRRDTAFRDRVEAVLAAHCRALATGQCGTARGYRDAGGRCASCRRAKRPRSQDVPAWRRRQPRASR